MPPLTIIALALAVLFTGIVGVITGGNSLINVPLMLLAGMSARQAVATNMFAVFFMTVSSTAHFARQKLISLELALPLCAITAIASALGAGLAVKLPEPVVKAVVGTSMGLLVAFMAFRPAAASRPQSIPATAAGLGFALTFVLGVYGGLFSGGYTTLMTVLGVSCFGLRMLESVALMKPVNLVSCAAACVVFFWAGLVDLRVGIPLAAANLVGGHLGARLAIRSSERWLRLLFLTTVAALAGKLLVYDLVIRRLVQG